MSGKYRWLLIFIFLAAFIIRFLYFPNDINFTYDQARDAFISLKVVSGDIKIIGPPTTKDGMFHGPLYYYVAGPIYLISGGNPEAVSAFLRIYNALGIFLVFLITSSLFNRRAGLFAAAVYAFSFEQSQYALFLGHPAMAVLTVLLFYLGLAYLFFKKDKRGLILSFVGLGLSIQFHFSLFFLVLPLILIFVFLKDDLPKIDRKNIFYSLIGFFITITTFLVAELKFGFKTTSAFTSILDGSGETGSINFRNVVFVAQRFVSDNIFPYRFEYLVLILLFLVLLYMFKNKKLKAQGTFLVIWFIGGLTPYLIDNSTLPTYYFGIAGSVSLIVLASFLLERIYMKKKLFGLLVLAVILIMNFQRISKINQGGLIAAMITQDKLLLTHQKQAIDYVYQDSKGPDFSVSALTNPYSVNTTWAYLFEWYGERNYGYLPVWGGDTAEGYEGNLEIIIARSELPEKRYVIVEPVRGIYPWLISDYFAEEDLFTEVVDEKYFGEIVVQVRRKI